MSTSSPSEPLNTSSPRWLDLLLTRLRVRIGLHSPREELVDALAENTPNNTDFSPQERAMLQNILKLRGLRVGDVMVPRADIIAIPAEMSLGDTLKAFRAAGHSRLPVYGETLDDPRGMVHIRDFVDHLAACAEKAPVVARVRRKNDRLDIPNLASVDLSQTLASARILRPVLYAPPSMPAVDLLARMQATRTHMALVIDEYGGTDGLISIEDLVEMVVGDIEDEHDDDGAPAIQSLGEDTYIADARVSLEEAADILKFNLAEDDIAEGIDTLAGLITTITGRVPARGEVIELPFGLECDVLDADARRIKRVRLYIRRTQSNGEKSPKPAPKSSPTPDMISNKDKFRPDAHETKAAPSDHNQSTMGHDTQQSNAGMSEKKTAKDPLTHGTMSDV